MAQTTKLELDGLKRDLLETGGENPESVHWRVILDAERCAELEAENQALEALVKKMADDMTPVFDEAIKKAAKSTVEQLARHRAGWDTIKELRSIIIEQRSGQKEPGARRVTGALIAALTEAMVTAGME